MAFVKSSLVVAAVLLYLSASFVFSIPVQPQEGSFPFKTYDEAGLMYNYERPVPGNGSEFENCTAGTPSNGTALCTSNTTLTGVSRRQIVVYQIIVPRSNSSEEESRIPTLVCCQAVGFDLNATSILEPIGCGLRKFGGVVYWGNATGNPGIQCLGIPREARLKWRYVPVVIGGDKLDVGGALYSDINA